jgi:hypothetical protein
MAKKAQKESSKVMLLSGGNPQIAKADGDAWVKQAADIPSWSGSAGT